MANHHCQRKVAREVTGLELITYVDVLVEKHG